MARKIVTYMVDDLDGKELDEGAGQTLSFAFEGVTYEIDLSEKNAEAMRKAFGKYTQVARRVPASRQPQGRRPRNVVSLVDAATGVNPRVVRAWAVEQGLMRADSRGRIPSEIVERYKAAQAS